MCLADMHDFVYVMGKQIMQQECFRYVPNRTADSEVLSNSAVTFTPTQSLVIHGFHSLWRFYWAQNNNIIIKISSHWCKNGVSTIEIWRRYTLIALRRLNVSSGIISIFLDFLAIFRMFLFFFTISITKQYVILLLMFSALFIYSAPFMYSALLFILEKCTISAILVSNIIPIN